MASKVRVCFSLIVCFVDITSIVVLVANVSLSHSHYVKPEKNSIFLKKGKTVISVGKKNYLDLG